MIPSHSCVMNVLLFLSTQLTIEVWRDLESQIPLSSTDWLGRPQSLLSWAPLSMWLAQSWDSSTFLLHLDLQYTWQISSRSSCCGVFCLCVNITSQCCILENVMLRKSCLGVKSLLLSILRQRITLPTLLIWEQLCNLVSICLCTRDRQSTFHNLNWSLIYN